MNCDLKDSLLKVNIVESFCSSSVAGDSNVVFQKLNGCGA